ncbi:MAG: F0F1 ATP synthase subunit A [Candidatus Omnitrophota bacterium]
MPEARLTQPELPNLVTLLEHRFEGTPFAQFLRPWENVIFSLLIVAILTAVAVVASRRKKLIPGRLQCVLELFVGGLDDFVCGILGRRHGRKFTPFIGTLFIYILFMNIFGLIPFMKSSTSSWSTTLALALCVFCFVQYSAIRELGFVGYLDHLMGRPRGVMAFTVLMPLMMFFLHVVSELVKPISLSLRLRSNIWGEDMMMAVLAGFGITGVPLLFFNFFLSMIACIVQATVFSLLTTIYLAFVLVGEDGEKTKGVENGL